MKAHVLAAVRAGRHVAIGSSGLSTEDYGEIDADAREQQVGVVAVGNVAITAALQRLAVEAARHLPAWVIMDAAAAATAVVGRTAAYSRSRPQPSEELGEPITLVSARSMKRSTSAVLHDVAASLRKSTPGNMLQREARRIADYL